MGVTLEKALYDFIFDISHDQFYEAHEHLEAYWHTIRKTEHPLKNLCKGFINGATAFELIKRGNYKGAKTLWGAHEKYLVLMHKGIESYDLFYQANEILFNLRQEHEEILLKNYK